MKLQRTQLILAVLTLLLGCSRSQHSQPVQTSRATAPEALKTLVENYYERFLAMNRLLDTSNFDARFDARKSNDISEQAVADALALEQESLQQLAGIDRAALSDEQRITYDMFKYERELDIEGFTFPAEQLPLDHLDSVPFSFARLGSGQPFATVADYDRLLHGIDAFVKWTDQAIANLKDGALHGVTEPKVIVERVIAKCNQLAVEDPTKSVFYQPIENFPEQVAPADRDRLTAAYTKAISERITPAYRKLATFLQKEYLPQARASIALSALPNGQRWYAHLIRYYTTTELNAQQIYELGRDELQRTRAEIDKVRAQIGIKDDLKTFLSSLRTDPKFNFTSAEEVLQTYEAIKGRVTPNLPNLFIDPPQDDFEIRAMDEATAASAGPAYATEASPGGSHRAVLYVNTSEPTQRPKYQSESVYLHQADPGHHLQMYMQTHMTELPRFRRFSVEAAYVEGWGLYAESLGRELGIYQDAYQYLGALLNDAQRSARLVVDTGLHARNWTREKAIAFMLENTALSEADAASEVDRYIAQPAQALAYKIGQLKIRELRGTAEKRLGSKFDVRAFHRAILDGGSMPLEILQKKVERWIQEREKMVE